jgi:hypothetical protein
MDGWWLELENLVLPSQAQPSPGQKRAPKQRALAGTRCLLQLDVNRENFSIVAMDVKCCVVLCRVEYSYNI